jgi:hypothetical protein
VHADDAVLQLKGHAVKQLEELATKMRAAVIA